MNTLDLPAVQAVARQVHPGYFERPEVFADRLALHPPGCRVLVGKGEAVIGYVVSHPWRFGDPPALDTLLVALPAHADTYYVHDLALLPAARGTGAATAVIDALRAHAVGWPRLSLVAVNASAPFWRRHGFEVVTVPGLAERLAGYDASALFMATSPN
jgi:GNAT superfamily N-acetyltransferase